MAEGEQVEVAPIGTRALLVEIGETLRGYEAHHREQAEQAASDLLETDRAATRSQDQARMQDRTAKADRNARLAGRIEALLLGWEG